MAAAPPTGFLLLPAPGDRTLHQIVRKLRLLALRRLLTQPLAGLDPALRGATERLQSALAGCARAAPDALLETVGAVDVLAPLLCLESGIAPAQRALAELGPSLIAGAARRLGQAIEGTWLWDVPVPRLLDAATGRCFAFEPPAVGLAADRRGLEVRLASGELVPLPPAAQTFEPPASCTLLHPLHRIEAAGFAIELAEVDTNPLAELEAHPEKRGNAVDLGGQPLDAWRERLGAALALIAQALPELAAEIGWSLQRAVPVGFDAERHLSASYREAPGLIYLTLHPSELTLAEAIIHETQHGKLNALSWFDPLLHNGQAEWARSPVRPDLRPLMGVLLAAHAFVPVAALHRRLHELDHPLAEGAHYRERRDEVLAQNDEALATVRRLGRPSALGVRLLADLEQLHAWTLRGA